MPTYERQVWVLERKYLGQFIGSMRPPQEIYTAFREEKNGLLDRLREAEMGEARRSELERACQRVGRRMQQVARSPIHRWAAEARAMDHVQAYLGARAAGLVE